MEARLHLAIQLALSQQDTKKWLILTQIFGAGGTKQIYTSIKPRFSAPIHEIKRTIRKFFLI